MSAKPEVLAPYPRNLRNFAEALRTSRHSKLLGGSAILLAGSTFVSLVNFAYNVAVARMLGAAAFSHAAVAITLLMLVSSITLSFQLVCAKFVARGQNAGQQAFIYRTLRRRAWMVGILLGAAMFAAAGPVSAYLRLPSRNLVMVLAVGMAFYVPLGARRGAMQGTLQFGKFSASMILETVVKFTCAVLLVKLGYGVFGAVLAISISVIFAYFVPGLGGRLSTPGEIADPGSAREGLQAILFFVGQVIINNIDILMVKHFFRPDEAGLYAAVALVGRVLYFASWSVVSAMFPISAAGASSERDGNDHILIIPMAIVTVLTLCFVAVLSLMPDFILHSVFGSRFNVTGGGADGLLAMYAAATGGYALSVVLMAYEISRRIANTAWLQLLVSALVVGGITLFHGSLREVVVVQQVLMALLFTAVAVPFVRSRRKRLEEAAA